MRLACPPALDGTSMDQADHVADPGAARWAQAVRECRRRLGLKQFAFAEMLGTSQSAVSRWEAGAQVPGYAMQNKVRDLLHKPLYDDRADRVLVAQVRHALGHACLADADLRHVHPSAALVRDHGGEGAVRAMVASPAFRELWQEQLAKDSWRAPVFGPDVVSVTGVDDRVRLSGDGLEIVSYIRYHLTPLRLSSGLRVMRLDRVDITPSDAVPFLGRRPDVVVLDDL